MQQALVVFSGDGVFRLGQIEQNGIVFEDDGILGTGKEVFQDPGELFWGHGADCFRSDKPASVTSDHRLSPEVVSQAMG